MESKDELIETQSLDLRIKIICSCIDLHSMCTKFQIFRKFVLRRAVGTFKGWTLVSSDFPKVCMANIRTDVQSLDFGKSRFLKVCMAKICADVQSLDFGTLGFLNVCVAKIRTNLQSLLHFGTSGFLIKFCMAKGRANLQRLDFGKSRFSKILSGERQYERSKAGILEVCMKGVCSRLIFRSTFKLNNTNNRPATEVFHTSVICSRTMVCAGF